MCLDSTVQNPTWTVTRREVTQILPDEAASTSEASQTYRSRTITTTERIQIVQVPEELSEESVALLQSSISPTGEASRRVESTTTTIQSGSAPLITGLTKDGRPLVGGLAYSGDARQTTTIITTTTTTYKLVDIEGGSDEYDRNAGEVSQLTLNLPLRSSLEREAEDYGYVFVSAPSSSPLSTLTTEEDEEASDERMSHSDFQTESAINSPDQHVCSWDDAFPTDSARSIDSFSDLDKESDGPDTMDADYVHLYKDGKEYLIFSRERYTGPVASTSRTREADEISVENVSWYATLTPSGTMQVVMDLTI